MAINMTPPEQLIRDLSDPGMTIERDAIVDALIRKYNFDPAQLKVNPVDVRQLDMDNLSHILIMADAFFRGNSPVETGIHIDCKVESIAFSDKWKSVVTFESVGYPTKRCESILTVPSRQRAIEVLPRVVLITLLGRYSQYFREYPEDYHFG